MADAHLSIGEVLGLLQDEFPDVTISKIRFLESQGLIDPERTPSGYRKFYEADIDRLRWILTQQRENFLPLKVIKDRLENANGAPDDDGGAPADGDGTDAEQAAAEPASTRSTVRASMPAGEAPDSQPIWMVDLARAGRGPKPTAHILSPPDPSATGTGSEVNLTAVELADAAGITMETLRELEQFGLVMGRAMGNDTYYDGDSLLIARKSAAFLGHGIGARHLRMFKVAAEREAGFLEQVAMPLLKQRNPEARREAVAMVEELADLGHDLRAALLRSKLRHHIDRA